MVMYIFRRKQVNVYDARSDAPLPYAEEIYLPPTDTGNILIFFLS